MAICEAAAFVGNGHDACFVMHALRGLRPGNPQRTETGQGRRTPLFDRSEVAPIQLLARVFPPMTLLSPHHRFP
jgi:hypothetical protein